MEGSSGRGKEWWAGNKAHQACNVVEAHGYGFNVSSDVEHFT